MRQGLLLSDQILQEIAPERCQVDVISATDGRCQNSSHRCIFLAELRFHRVKAPRNIYSVIVSLT
jgi:hypothetical protein